TCVHSVPSQVHVSARRLDPDAPPNKTMHFRAESKAIAKPCRADGPVSATCVQRAPSQLHVSANGGPPGSPPNRTTRLRSPSYVRPWLVRLLGPMFCFWVQKKDDMRYPAMLPKTGRRATKKSHGSLKSPVCSCVSITLRARSRGCRMGQHQIIRNSCPALVTRC